MKYLILLSFTTFLFSNFNLMGQSIHPLELIQEHYKQLSTLDDRPNTTRSDLDDISFPMEGRATGQQFIGWKPTYLRDGDVVQLKALRMFPANSSDQTKAELEYLQEWQAKRTLSDKKRALEIARIGYWPPLDMSNNNFGNTEHLFWECQSILDDCDVADYPATARLLAGVTRDARIIEFTIKYHLLRARPYHLEPTLESMGRVPNPSFASGHTLWAYIQAFTWSELMPERRKAFLDLAFEVGLSREIMGIHYPSDEEAARIIAHTMLSLMMKNDDFRNDLAKARSEWK